MTLPTEEELAAADAAIKRDGPIAEITLELGLSGGYQDLIEQKPVAIRKDAS